VRGLKGRNPDEGSGSQAPMSPMAARDCSPTWLRGASGAQSWRRGAHWGVWGAHPPQGRSRPSQGVSGAPKYFFS